MRGLAQIDFPSGAKVMLVGPARLDLISPLRGKLHSGKLRQLPDALT